MAMFDEAATSRIAARVSEIEKRTAGEIVVALTARSDDYYGTRALVALFVATLTAVLARLFIDRVPGEYSLLFELGAGTFAFWLSGQAWLLRHLVPGEAIDRMVRLRALATFVERGVHYTRDASGVLVFLSEDERAAVVLGDRGVHARVGDAGWHKALEKLLAALTAGEAERGLLGLLDEVGAVLEREFPRRVDDRNELPDAVVRLER